MTVGKKIKEVREKRDLTQFQLARDANLSMSSITKIEQDQVANLTLKTLAKIASGLKTTVVELLDGVEIDFSED